MRVLKMIPFKCKLKVVWILVYQNWRWSYIMYLAQGTRQYDHTLLPQCLRHVTALFRLHTALKLELLLPMFPVIPSSCLDVVISSSNSPSPIILVVPLFNMKDHKSIKLRSNVKNSKNVFTDFWQMQNHAQSMRVGDKDIFFF